MRRKPLSTKPYSKTCRNNGASQKDLAIINGAAHLGFHLDVRVPGASQHRLFLAHGHQDWILDHHNEHLDVPNEYLDPLAQRRFVSGDGRTTSVRVVSIGLLRRLPAHDGIGSWSGGMDLRYRIAGHQLHLASI